MTPSSCREPARDVPVLGEFDVVVCGAVQPAFDILKALPLAPHAE